MSKKKMTLVRHAGCLIVAAVIMLISIFCLRVKVQINNPDVNIVLDGIEHGENHEFEAKRAHGDKVYMNVPARDFGIESLRIRFACDEGTSTVIYNIQIAVGNHVMFCIDDFTASYIDTHNVEINNDGYGTVVLTTGEEPCIQINGVFQFVHRWILLHAVFMFGVGFLLSELVLVLWKKYGQKVKSGVTAVKNILWDIRLEIIIWIAVIAVAGVLLIGFDLVTIQGISNLELLFWLMGLGVIYFGLRARTDNRKIIFGLLAVLAVLLWISVYDITTYLTVDEPKSIDDQYFLQANNLEHWYCDEARMNYLIMGTIWKLVPDAFIASGLILYEQLGKLIHWLCGIILLVLTAAVTEKHLLNTEKKEKRVFGFAFVLASMFSVTLIMQALKNYNYDLFSMLFAILGVIETIIYVKKQKASHAVLAVIFLACGLQEKLTALPAWLICSVIITGTAAAKRHISAIGKAGLCGLYGLVYCAGTAGVFWLTQKYVLDMLLHMSPLNHFSDAVEMLCTKLNGGVQVFVEALGKPVDGNLWKISGICLILGIWLVSVIYLLFRKYIWEKTGAKGFNVTLALLTGLFLGMGIILGFGNEIDPGVSRAYYLMRYARDFTRSFPTVLLIGILLSLVLAWFKKEKDMLYVAIAADVLAVAFFYTVANVADYIQPRYLDIYISILVIFAAMIVWNYYAERMTVKIRNMVVGGILFILTVTEIVGSGPAFTFFYPIWYQGTLARNEIGVYAYWGEEWKIAGELVEEYCEENDIPLENVALHCGYQGGRWLTDPYGIDMTDRAWMYRAGNHSMTDTDFYVFESQSVLRGIIPCGLPDAEPVITITYRGIATARIYLGSDLEDYFSKYEEVYDY